MPGERQVETCVNVVVQLYGMPAMTPAPANTSGQVAIISEVCAAPPEWPMMKMRLASMEWSAFSFSIIWMIDWFSPSPRVRFSGSPNSPAQLKQRSALLLVCCSGYST